MALALDGTNRVETLLQTPFTERNGIVSPDRRWLAYESDSSGLFQIYVRPFPNANAGEARLISTDGGTRPLWSPSGRELLYVAPDGALMSVVVSVEGRDGPWSAGSPGKVVDGPYLTEVRSAAALMTSPPTASASSWSSGPRARPCRRLSWSSSGSKS